MQSEIEKAAQRAAQPTELSGAATSLNAAAIASSAGAFPTASQTRRRSDGSTKRLFILGKSTLGDPNTYLGTEPIDEI